MMRCQGGSWAVTMVNDVWANGDGRCRRMVAAGDAGGCRAGDDDGRGGAGDGAMSTGRACRRM